MTKHEIKRDLAGLGIVHGDVVFFHSSLKSIGHVDGGADAVIDAFLETVGETGTLVLPALCRYDWETMTERDVDQAWDPASTPTFTGIIPETFRKRPGVMRSGNPTHSVTALGRHAVEITRGHRNAHGAEGAPGRPVWASRGSFGVNSPWDKLYRLNAAWPAFDFAWGALLKHAASRASGPLATLRPDS